MSRINLDDVNKVEDPLRSFSWTMQFLIPQGGYSEDIPPVYVQDVSLPFEYFDVKPRYRGGGHMYFPGDSNVDGFSVTFYETDKVRVLRYIAAWRRLITSSTTNPNYNIITPSNFLANYNMPKAYMGGAIATFYDDMDNVAMVAALYDVWPNKLNDWQLNYQQSTNIPLVCGFSCNSMEILVNNDIDV